MRLHSLSLLALCLAAAVMAGGVRLANADLRQQVQDSEHAFARALREGDVDGFARYLAREAVFIGDGSVARGREAVLEAWRGHTGRQAPFAWQPGRVEVVESGTLAYASGPIRDREGRPVGSFDSVWRLEAPGRWRIVFGRIARARD